MAQRRHGAGSGKGQDGKGQGGRFREGPRASEVTPGTTLTLASQQQAEPSKGVGKSAQHAGAISNKKIAWYLHQEEKGEAPPHIDKLWDEVNEKITAGGTNVMDESNRHLRDFIGEPDDKIAIDKQNQHIGQALG